MRFRARRSTFDVRRARVAARGARSHLLRDPDDGMKGRIAARVRAGRRNPKIAENDVTTRNRLTVSSVPRIVRR
ncbi:hypothetical protein C6Q28_22995 [Burkholderia multivorans]|uniref:Uncharacterized protein n=1 Tax=Burkholderia multivorans TaxID=87883 RepID=A0A228EGU9_9BURK|nr:hypothetical protein CA831_02070 [Burkholderia multivorans]OXH93047.1 hypothetical protein CA830_09870 [Burkholderia multivorans]PRD98880.1 hypothetical protein C6P91_30520 [Burkholderia multivorans]PRE84412.1 hypothetical protein C6Q02_13585 [Burkholderia multivorans]PRE94737.1 hypothetical protein C6Q07_32970 [Burkholderia multivorans]